MPYKRSTTVACCPIKLSCWLSGFSLRFCSACCAPPCCLDQNLLRSAAAVLVWTVRLIPLPCPLEGNGAEYSKQPRNLLSVCLCLTAKGVWWKIQFFSHRGALKRSRAVRTFPPALSGRFDCCGGTIRECPLAHLVVKCWAQDAVAASIAETEGHRPK